MGLTRRKYPSIASRKRVLYCLGVTMVGPPALENPPAFGLSAGIEARDDVGLTSEEGAVLDPALKLLVPGICSDEV
jgi:hypothetical protein